MIYLIIISALAISQAFTLYQYIKIKKQIKNQKESAELQEFLVDLMSGEAIVKVSRVNPTDLFLRSPRHGRR